MKIEININNPLNKLVILIFFSKFGNFEIPQKGIFFTDQLN